MKPKPLVLSTSPTFGTMDPKSIQRLHDAGLSVEVISQDDEDAIRARLPRTSAWVVGLRPVTADHFDLAPLLRILFKPGAGTENIDVAAASARSIVVKSASGMNSDAVAEYALGLLLAVVRRIPAADQAVRSGHWPRIVGTEVAGKTLGLVGLGHIGRAVAKRARALGLRVIGYDVLAPQPQRQPSGVVRTNLQVLLETADFVSLHVPLTDDTQGLIGRNELARMKLGSFLINTSRGGVVDETALVEALDSGHLAGAAVDVFATEPPQSNNPLLHNERVLLSPHSAGYTTEALDRIGTVCADAILAALAADASIRPST